MRYFFVIFTLLTKIGCTHESRHINFVVYIYFVYSEGKDLISNGHGKKSDEEDMLMINNGYVFTL